MNGRIRNCLTLVFVSSFFPFTVVPAHASSLRAPAMIDLHVDASHASQGFFHADETIPISPGNISLDYPKWIPGEHGPTGSTLNISRLVFSANGQVLSWRRDLIQPFQFHLTIPPGATSVVASFDYLDNIGSSGRFDSNQETTPNLAMIVWNHFTFYPDGQLSQNLQIKIDVALPESWQYASALETANVAGSTIQFKPASLYTVVDSPLLTGAYFVKLPLTIQGTTPPVELDIAADKPDDLQPANDKLQAMKSLVVQARLLFDCEHYRHYNFLIALSDHIAENGLEHHESTEIALPEDSLSDDEAFVDNADTLSHEYFHSWNGKYRRPQDLGTPDFIAPQETDLLWVYEGLTQYYGFVLAARSGLLTQDQVEEYWSSQLEWSDHESGRSWRPLQDTADDAPEFYDEPNIWYSELRFEDFYDESAIDWLEADTIIRDSTNDKKSLDDFCRLFFAGSALQSNAPVFKPYTESEVITALNEITPYDWHGFWNMRLKSVSAPNLEKSFQDAGWELVHNSTNNPRDMGINIYDAGLGCHDDGSISNVVPYSLAFTSGLAPGMRIVAVNGRPFSPQVLFQQVNAAVASSSPIQLIVEEDQFYKVIGLNYHDGLQYPHLQRISSTPDLLSQIFSPQNMRNVR